MRNFPSLETWACVPLKMVTNNATRVRITLVAGEVKRRNRQSLTEGRNMTTSPALENESKEYESLVSNVLYTFSLY
jgi:hypothetical protein